MIRDKKFRVPWKLRATPLAPSHVVDVVMNGEAYELMARLRERVLDSSRSIEERSQIMDELHLLFEMHYHFPDTEMEVIPPPEAVVEDRTEALQAVESLEAKGWHVPQKLKDSLADGQLSLGEGSHVATDT